MKKIILTSVFVLAATVVNAKTIYYPKDACAEITSAEYSTAGGDSSIQLYQILCKDANGKYTTFVTGWSSASSFFGLGRVFYEEQIDLVPYDGNLLQAE
jgi:hypothetical protein